jgi:hypothetical protein
VSLNNWSILVHIAVFFSGSGEAAGKFNDPSVFGIDLTRLKPQRYCLNMKMAKFAVDFRGQNAWMEYSGSTGIRNMLILLTYEFWRGTGARTKIAIASIISMLESLE